MNIFTLITQDIVYALIALLFVWVAKKFADKRTTGIDDDDQIENKSNMAIGTRRAGLYLGGIIAMTGVLTGPSHGWFNDIVGLIIYGGLSYVLLFGAREINDRIILGNINNDEECHGGNTAVGIAELGNYIATGLIINGCVSGDGAGMIHGIVSTVVFFAIGQLVLLGLVWVYEFMAGFNCLDEIGNGNIAAAIMVAGKCIALGFILRTSILGPTNGWAADIKSFALSAVVGVVLLLALNKAIDKMLLPNTNLHQEVSVDRNIAAVLVTQTATIGLALIIATVV